MHFLRGRWLAHYPQRIAARVWFLFWCGVGERNLTGLFAWIGLVVLRAFGRLPRRKAAAITALILLWGTLCAVFIGLKFVFYSFYFQAWPHEGLFRITAVAKN
jgi:hypothetical protein